MIKNNTQTFISSEKRTAGLYITTISKSKSQVCHNFSDNCALRYTNDSARQCTDDSVRQCTDGFSWDKVDIFSYGDGNIDIRFYNNNNKFIENWRYEFSQRKQAFDVINEFIFDAND